MYTLNESAIEMGRELAAEFAQRAAEADKAGKLPAEDIAALKASGYEALTIPKEFGGQALPLLDCVAAHLELAQGSTSTALVAGMHMHIMGNQRDTRAWFPEKYEMMCRLSVKEGAIVNSVASEPALGSPSRGGSFQTFADVSEDGHEWIINGHKLWITGGKHLTHLLVKLSTAEGNGMIMVEQGTPGLRWDETWQDALSLRASDSHDLYLENVRVPKENLMEPIGQKNPSNVWFPLVMAATYLGGAFGARAAVIQYALERVPTPWAKPIATLPKIQRQIGEIDMSLQAARALLLEVASEWKGDGDRTKFMPRVAAAKTIVTETANRVTEKTLQIAGGASISNGLPLERFFRDVRAGSMQPPSGDTALELIGRAAIERVSG